MADTKNNEVYDPTSKREIIKSILIVFLLILLILTFFSNTIMNRSLSEISTERTASGNLTERIRGSGLVESNQTYDVMVKGNKKVDTIKVKEGKEVKKGDVLFTVGGEETEEMISAESALTELELEYQKALLTPPDDYTSENQAIRNAREDLNAAVAKRDEAASKQGEIQAAKDNYAESKSKLSYYTKLQTKLQSTISALDADELSGAAPEYTSEIIVLKDRYDAAVDDYRDTLSELSGGTASDRKGGFGDDEDYDDYEVPTLSPEQTAAAKAELSEKAAVRDAAKAEYENMKYQLRNELTAKLEDAEANIDVYTEQSEKYGDIVSDSKAMSLETLEEDVKAKQRTLDGLITELGKTQKEGNTKSKITSLELEAKKKEIEKAKQKLDKMKKQNSVTEIKSEYSGVVSSINIKTGDTTIPDTPLMTIDISEEGYTVKITVDGQKSQKAKKGVEAEVVNNWSGDVEAVLTDIKNDTSAGSKNRVFVFSVKGDVDSGTYLDLSIPCGSGSYDAIVPKSAVYEDKNGKFVLTVTSKSSPLGNRYYAERVNVDVLASDETSSAVSGISAGDYVITAASKPVSAGDQVRMKDK